VAKGRKNMLTWIMDEKVKKKQEQEKQPGLTEVFSSLYMLI